MPGLEPFSGHVAPPGHGAPTITPMTALRLYGIPNCDSVKRARALLAGQSVIPEFHNFKTQGVPEQRLRAWVTSAGWTTLLNRKGSTWRALDEATRATVVDAESACALMRAHSSLIKRPVIEWADGRISVGLDTWPVTGE